jgi:AcrR family transcriptional regulator
VASLPDHLLPAAVGKGRISKGVLEQHQRRRVLEAATEVFARRGYQSSTVDQLVSAARIGVGSFYALFESREDCFLQVYDMIVAEAEERLAAAVDPEAESRDRVVEGLRAMLELVAEEPNRARVAIVEAPTAGNAAEARYAETEARLVAWLREGRSAAASDRGPTPAFEHAAVAGLAWILHQRLAVGQVPAVEQLLPEMADFLVGPNGPARISKR